VVPPRNPRQGRDRRFRHGCVKPWWREAPADPKFPNTTTEPHMRARPACLLHHPKQKHADSRRLRVAAGGRTLLEGELANPIKVDEDTGVDWELVGGASVAAAAASASSRRAVRIALQKEAPRADMVHWWSCAIKGHREIDTGKIQVRGGVGRFFCGGC
jgi:hypothetical protein